MAIFKAIANPSSNIGGTKGALEYISKKAELTKGINCSDNSQEAFKDFQETKELYHKEGGRQFKHFVLSFAENEGNKEIALKMSEEVSKELFKDNEVYLAVHTDTKNIHCHMIVNSVNMRTGEKLSQSKKDLANYKNIVNEKGKKYNISLTKNTENYIGDIRANTRNKKKVIENNFLGKQESDIVNTYKLVTKVLSENNIKNIDEFSLILKKEGVTVDWQDQRKNVTFELDEKYAKSKKRKFRLTNLEKTFSDNRLTKENLQNLFEKNREFERGEKEYIKNSKQRKELERELER